MSDIKKLKSELHEKLEEIIFKDIKKLYPVQKKSISHINSKDNLIVCAPTAGGKTLVAELILVNNILKTGTKAVYIVPLKALASEKYKYFSEKYPFLNVGVSSGDYDSNDYYLKEMDIIIVTSEKFDSLLRKKVDWIDNLGVVIVDEIHLMNEKNRGPTLEIVITHILREDIRIVGLSATIGNPKELSEWLNAKLIYDEWRPVKLKQGVYKDNKIIFKE